MSERDAGARGDGGRSAADLWDLIRRGQYLEAYDRAATAIDHGAGDPEVRYLAVLALARSGATAQARRRYREYRLDEIETAGLRPSLADDIAALGARLDKDEALSRDDPAERSAWAVRAAERYEAAHRLSHASYHAVNAASMWLLAGDTVRAGELAGRALAAGNDQAHGYWDAATEAEAALVVGDLERARLALHRAGTASTGHAADRATTLRQLKLVCSLTGIDPGVLAPIRNPAVVHYCGHRIAAVGEAGRFPATDERLIRRRLEEHLEELDAGVGFGSLAAGADILAAELLLERGAELNVVLPFQEEEFARISVAPAGESWVQRFEACLAEAAHVEVATPAEYLDDPVMFDLCSRIAMGDALLRARQLETDVHQVAVWDGSPPSGVAGTAVDVATWQATGAPSVVIPLPPGAPGPTALPSHRRHIRAILFADFAGFSQLGDAQLLSFQHDVMTALAEALDPHRPQLLSGRTWGDGIYLVFSDVAAAAAAAFGLVSAVADMDLASLGLPQLRGLRVAAHAAPVFEGWDPISESDIFFGIGVTQAARIEPRTPEGEIYTTHAFAALAVLSGSDRFDCQYVGILPTAKRFGDMPLYALHRRAGVGRDRLGGKTPQGG